MKDIRALHPGDIPGCARIMAENPLWIRYGITLQSAEERISSGLAQGATILVAGLPGEPQGFIWYVEKGAFKRSGYVMLVGVDVNRQGQGIGDILMEEAERLMFLNCGDVFLLVSDFNESAQKFYQRRGYEQVGSIPGYVLPDVSELIFRKKKP